MLPSVFQGFGTASLEGSTRPELLASRLFSVPAVAVRADPLNVEAGLADAGETPISIGMVARRNPAVVGETAPPDSVAGAGTGETTLPFRKVAGRNGEIVAGAAPPDAVLEIAVAARSVRSPVVGA